MVKNLTGLLPGIGGAARQWRFFRAGGFDQVKLETGADLMALDQLDYKLWVALACPTTGVELDQATLELIDTDKDARVRAPELIAAVKWAGAVLKNPDDLLKCLPSLPLASINDATAEGKLIAAFATQVLGKGDADLISVEEASKAEHTFASKPFNGDGVVPVETASDEETKALIGDIMACLGPESDVSGRPGVSQLKLERFAADAAAYSEWWKKAESDKAILPLGLNTTGAVAALKAVQPKIEDYFTRCRIASFEPRFVEALNREEKDFVALAAKDFSAQGVELAGFPLARIAAGAPLPLREGLNPAWTAAMSAFQEQTVRPFLGEKDSLRHEDWQKLLALLAPFEEWNRSKVGGSVEKLGVTRIRALLSGTALEKLRALLAKDKAEQGHAAAVGGLNRLVRYHRDLARLCNNFVSFRDFYGRKEKAIFQAGTLYLDQRSCDLCLTVEDPAKHAVMAGLAGTYLAYCDCLRKGSGEKMQIVAAFTDGDSDNLMVGRNGIFFDRKGRDWDATIIKIIDNPISIRQAFWAPYKKLVRMIEEQVAKRAAAADAAVNADLAGAAQVTAGTAPPPKPPEPAKPKIDTGTLAAIGLVLTTLLAALGGIFGRIAGLPAWQIPLAILSIVVLISTPSMVMAYLKLRRRNLGPILDANGWAINAKAKMNVPFGGSLTAVASLPLGAQRDLVDPFAEKKSVWPKVAVVVAVLALAYFGLNSLGYIYQWSNGQLGKPLVGSTTPAATNAPPPSAK